MLAYSGKPSDRVEGNNDIEARIGEGRGQDLRQGLLVVDDQLCAAAWIGHPEVASRISVPFCRGAGRSRAGVPFSV